MKAINNSLLALMLLLTLSASSQSEVITWQSQSIKNLRNGEEAAYVCLFRIYTNDRIEWIQGEGQNISSYQITSTEGILPEEGIGKVTYNINKEGYFGKLTIERTRENNIVLILDMSSISSTSAYYTFFVSKY